MNYFRVIGFFGCLLTTALFSDVTISMYSTSGNQMIGTIKASDTAFGLMLTPNLSHLPPGVHGFHVHDKPTCGEEGMAAGGHLDPAHTEKHLGPYNDDGHLGDLPVIIVDQNGNATMPVLAPRLNVADILGHSLMIHEGGDNYSDQPANGGGGKRIACGVIQSEE
ncbi:MAG: superoxide dismutase family protein [Parachlamydiales bacterium]|nr:superoxide dismutase family protein [Parachlamydiales bacterium]